MSGKGKQEAAPAKGSKTFKVPVEFAPLNLPLERRLQTLGVLWFIMFPLICYVIVIYSLFNEYLQPVMIPYLLWFYFADSDTPQNGIGRRRDFLRRLPMHRWMRDYFPVHLHKTAELDPRGNYLFAYHPHGVIGVGAFINFGTEANNISEVYPGLEISPCTLSVNFNTPLIREYIMGLGMAHVGKESLCNMLLGPPGRSALIVVGGANEALEAHPGSYALTLKRRRGFIKMALITGASLVPVFGFGENDLWDQVPNPQGSMLRQFQRRALNSMSVSMPLIKGRGIFQYSYGLLPHRRPVHVVVGKPIKVQRVLDPTQAEITELQETYMNALRDLYNEHKDKYELAIPRRKSLVFDE
eukprot:Clim_evm54s214 gene=Clim_evmTU54s214